MKSLQNQFSSDRYNQNLRDASSVTRLDLLALIQNAAQLCRALMEVERRQNYLIIHRLSQFENVLSEL